MQDMRWCHVNPLLDDLLSCSKRYGSHRMVPPGSLRWRARQALGGAIGSGNGVVEKLLGVWEVATKYYHYCVSYR